MTNEIKLQILVDKTNLKSQVWEYSDGYYLENNLTSKTKKIGSTYKEAKNYLLECIEDWKFSLRNIEHNYIF